MYTAKEFRARALQMVGLPYILGSEWATSIKPPARPKAVDCSELVEGLFRENGTPVGDLAANQYDKTVAVSGAVHVGDLVFLKNNPARWNRVGHVAVITAKLSNGDWEIVEARGHAYGVVKTTLSYWKKRSYFTGVRRFPKFKLAADGPVVVDMGKLRANALYVRQTTTGSKVTDAIALITKQSAVEGAAWKTFSSLWYTKWKKLELFYNIPDGIATDNHAFVVLGGGTKDDGSIGSKTLRRVKLGLAAALKYPNSKIVVSGGAPKKGYTEAYRMREYLLNNGIPESRIIYEDQSSSTVGNAKYSVPKMIAAGITSYTIVSDASHIRRASILFSAAILKQVYGTGKNVNLTEQFNVAYKDKAVAAVGTSATMATIANNVAILLGILSKYNAVVSANKISYPTLKVGSKGTWVKALQKKLGITVDGDFGAKTKAAVKKAQKKLKLEVDGVAGPITLKALGVSV